MERGSRDARFELHRRAPDLSSGFDIDRERPLAVDHVHHAVVNRRRREFALLIHHTRIPDGHQAFHVGLIDLVQRAEALPVIAHAVGEDVFRILTVVNKFLRRLPEPRRSPERRRGYGLTRNPSSSWSTSSDRQRSPPVPDDLARNCPRGNHVSTEVGMLRETGNRTGFCHGSAVHPARGYRGLTPGSSERTEEAPALLGMSAGGLSRTSLTTFTWAACPWGGSRPVRRAQVAHVPGALARPSHSSHCACAAGGGHRERTMI